MAPSATRSCTHQSISFVSSSHAEQAGFRRQNQRQLALAANLGESFVQSRRDLSVENPKTFPASLVLPGDDLYEDPEHESQSFQKWLGTKARKSLTPKRKTIYVVPPPHIESDVDFMRSWIKPQCHEAESREQSPDARQICDYLEAFYHGVAVKLMPASTLSFTVWDAEKKTSKSARTSYVGLKSPKEITRIRARPSLDGVFGGQINLNDMLDAARSMLPRDAFAIMFLVQHDMYEDEDDEFACGRAYGGSRISIVSSARYNPDLDELEDIDRLHAWPASHCEGYMSECCAESVPKAKRQKRSNTAKNKPQESGTAPPPRLGALEAAVAVYRGLPSSKLSPSMLSALWLGRVCRTASHELGHCFGMNHCVYYACCMQGSASIREDARQPPYLCPVDLAKLLHEISGRAVGRYKALLAFCERPEVKGTHFFAPFAAWIRRRLDELDGPP